jgi:deoxyribose-phosphate aldolase
MAGAAPASPRDLARLIDHTLLRTDATRDDLTRLCGEAREHGFATVCVRSEHVKFCARLLEGRAVKPICVVDFPAGLSATEAKVAETLRAVDDGAAEIDMVLHVPRLKARDHRYVLADIRSVVDATRSHPLKVILETGALTHDEKVIACALAKAAGAAFVKTSTGFGPGGATVEDVALMRSIVGDDMGVKASGGIRTAGDALRMIAAGATRLGTSASVAIVTAANAGAS